MRAVSYELVPLRRIVADLRAQIRAGGTDPAVIGEYAELYRSEVELPPLVVFEDPALRHQVGGRGFWLADGFHRLPAAREACLDEVEVEVHEGTLRDAIRYALSANQQHGLRRTNADKRRAVELALADDEWSAWSDRRVADLCGVSHTFVALVRRIGESSPTRPPTEEPERPNAENPIGVATVATPEPVLAAGELAGASVRIGDEVRSIRLADRPAAAPPEPPVPPRGVSAMPPEVANAPADVELEPPTAAPTQLEERPEDDEEPRGRDELDRYYTPLPTALAVVWWLSEHVEALAPLVEWGDEELRDVVEPCVGSGRFVQALRAVWPRAEVDRVDIDPEAAGLELDLRRGELVTAADWREGDLARTYLLAVTNPPYAAQTIVDVIDGCRARAKVTAVIVRETFTGSARRLAWLRADPPRWVVKLVGRPRWEGPSARRQGDMCDTVLLVWVDGDEGPTEWSWLDLADVPAELRQRAGVP